MRADAIELHEEGPHRMLEVGDRAVGIGKGGQEMGKDLSRWSARRFGRQFGRRSACRECRADFALAQVEPSPDALPGSFTSSAIGDGAVCRDDAVGDGALQESPQGAGCHAQLCRTEL